MSKCRHEQQCARQCTLERKKINKRWTQIAFKNMKQQHFIVLRYSIYEQDEIRESRKTHKRKRFSHKCLLMFSVRLKNEHTQRMRWMKSITFNVCFHLLSHSAVAFFFFDSKSLHDNTANAVLNYNFSALADSFFSKYDKSTKIPTKYCH